jgi:NTP pyrophosphatase (non-canonical NTP hydrolase)
MTDDSFTAMMAAVQAFHHKHRFAENGGEELTYRIALMTEELGEMAECVTKGKGQEALAEETADLFILLLGTAIAGKFDLGAAFWDKMQRLEGRRGRMIDGRIRVSEFDGVRQSEETDGGQTP